jgi:uncharacterized phage protein (TIGR02220 family)
VPYSNIVWIKLYLELFDEDDRFLYQLTERQQLLYIKMLYLAGRQKNKISKNPESVIQKVNYKGSTGELLGDIKAIKNIFKKLKENKYYYTFTNFDTLHNRVSNGTSQGTPKELQRVIPDKDKDKEEDKEVRTEVIGYLNEKIGTSYRPSTKSTQEKIRARLHDGFTVADFKAVIDKKVAQWQKDPKMAVYLRPETLFGTKFEGYLNEIGPKKDWRA